MKKSLSMLAIVFFSASLFAFSFPNPDAIDWNLSVEPLFGCKIGELGEYVYQQNCRYSDNKLSELNWDIKSAVYLGAKIAGGWKGIGLSTYVTGAIPKRSGIVMDSDWLNKQYANAENYLYKTNYSESDNYLESNWSWGIQGGYTFRPWYFFECTPFVAFDIDYKAFTAKDGYFWYAKTISGTNFYSRYDDSKNNKEGAFSENNKGYTGVDIEYNRYTYLLWIGANLHFNIPYGIGFDIGFQIAPYLYSISRDNHVLTKSRYADIVRGSFEAYKWMAAVSYRFTKHILLSLGGEFFWAKTIQGDTYVSTNDGKTYDKNSTIKGGAGEYYFDAHLSLRYIFF